MPEAHRVETRPDPPDLVLVGFHPPENWGRWASSATPSLILSRCTARRVTLDIRGYPGWPPRLSGGPTPDELQVEVVINGRREHSLPFTRAVRDRRLDLPVSCIDGRMSVRFEYGHLIVPREQGMSSDLRPLGIGIVGTPGLD